MKCKLIFGARDVSIPSDKNEQPWPQSSDFFDVLELSQIVIDITPADMDRLEAKIFETKKKLHLEDLHANTIGVLKRTFIEELVTAATISFIKTASAKIVDHMERQCAST